MIILDTSIWIERLKGNDNILKEIEPLAVNNMICTISPIFGELLQGCKNDKERSHVLAYWHQTPKMSEENLFIESGLLASKENFFNKGIGIIDACIIRTTIANNLKLWTLDKKIIQFLNKNYLFNY